MIDIKTQSVFSVSDFEIVDDTYIFKMLLPKGFELNDYSPTEDLIELEDTRAGERFWVPVAELFRRKIGIGKASFIGCHGANLITGKGFKTIILKSFDGLVFRRRHYIKALFTLESDGQEAKLS